MKHRNSNIELLRIICMLMIILHHLSIYGPWHSSDDFATEVVNDCLAIGGKIGVNCFILITGYFQSQSTFKSKSFLRICLQVYCYAIIFYLCYATIIHFPSANMTIRSFLPLVTDLNWFIPPYLLIYILSPFFNKLINHYPTAYLSSGLAFGFIILSIIPTICLQSSFESNFIWFTYLYFLGGSIRAIKATSQRAQFDPVRILLRYKKRYTLLCLTFILLTINIFNFLNHSLSLSTNSLTYISQWSTPILLLSISLFTFFTNCTIPYISAVNSIAQTSLGVYLIHDNPLIREAWDLTNGKINIYPVLIPIVALLIVITIYACSSLIDMLRIFIIERPSMQYIEQHFSGTLEKWDKQMSR